jgi:hypothetical protein
MVEVDAKYIWGMLNNPDIHPNVAVNHWITGISLFDFTLRHVPGNKHVAPDGLSRRPMALGDEEEPTETAEDVEDWIEEILGCGVWMANELEKGWSVKRMTSTLSLTTISHNDNPPSTVPSHDDDDLRTIQKYLETLSFPSAVSIQEQTRLVKRACQFFVQGNCLW